MPSTMQQSIVRKSASSSESVGFGMALLIAMTPLMSLDARPVTVMQPAIIPAMAQATATVMLPLPPASSESRIMRPVFLAVMPATLPVLVSRTSAEASQMVPTRLTAMEIRMAIAAENCSERMFAVTIQIRNTSGSSR